MLPGGLRSGSPAELPESGQRPLLTLSIPRSDYMLSLMRTQTEDTYGAVMTHIEKPDCDSPDGHVLQNDAKHLHAEENPAMTKTSVDSAPDAVRAVCVVDVIIVGTQRCSTPQSMPAATVLVGWSR